MSANSDPYNTSVDNSVVFSATDKPLFDAFKPLPLVPQDSWRIKSDLFALNLSSGHDITQEEEAENGNGDEYNATNDSTGSKEDYITEDNNDDRLAEINDPNVSDNINQASNTNNDSIITIPGGESDADDADSPIGDPIPVMESPVWPKTNSQRIVEYENSSAVNHLNLIQIKGWPAHPWQPYLQNDDVIRPSLNGANINKLILSNFDLKEMKKKRIS